MFAGSNEQPLEITKKEASSSSLFSGCGTPGAFPPVVLSCNVFARLEADIYLNLHEDLRGRLSIGWRQDGAETKTLVLHRNEDSRE